MDGPSNARVGTAAADVAGHRFIDVLVGRLGILVQQDGGAHDLSGLAVAALRDVDFDPGALHGMGIVARKAFDGGDVLAGNAGERRYARADRDAVKMDGAGSAKRHAAAEFCAGEAEGIANHPQKWRGWIVVHGNRFPIQGEGSHVAPPESGC